ncbi:MAG: iron-containing alcohol dehydrogenase [Chloracidobacterium sp.]|nr:iron-containing alcohol dehydrogenase [Chloracidobacterium sp.]MDW8218021.1 iron-containing alcohol dehydrogenase [Acidobacteriota bacterium]
MGFITGNPPLTRPDATFVAPTEIKYGVGKVGNLTIELQLAPDLAERTRVAVFTDPGVAAVGLLDVVRQAFADSDYTIVAVIADVPPESDTEFVKQAAAKLNEQEVSLIVALGGGSVMDTAKIAAVIAAYGGEAGDYEGGFMVPGPITPIIAIPTTVGTGSEVTLAAVVKDNIRRRKLTIGSPFLFPRMAVLDPNMVATLPAKLVAWTGFDALTHAIEAYSCAEREPISAALALGAIELIADNLEAAMQETGPTEARAKMQYAATMAAMAFSNSPVGAVHAIAHSVGALFGIHHGLSNAIALPFVMEFNLPAVAAYYAAVARALGVKDVGQSTEALAEAGIAAVRALKQRCGVPAQYREVGVPTDPDTAAAVTDLTLEDICLSFNPVKAERDAILALVTRTL